MSSIKIDSVSELKDPKFVKPIQINYSIGNEKRTWEAVVAYDNVAILL